MATIVPLRLNQDKTMIERMELDLSTKAQTAFVAAGVNTNVYGVFSLDDLESKTEDDLCQKIALGVGYAGAEPTTLSTNPKDPLNVGSFNAAKAVDFIFTIILAVPTGPGCLERYRAAELLTVLRMGIMGSIVDGDRTSRTWAFVKEFPNISESTDSMLYYSQVWRVMLIATGPM